MALQMTKNLVLPRLTSVALMCLLCSCGNGHLPFTLNAQTNHAGSAQGSQNLSFQQNVLPLLKEKCSICHNACSPIPNWLDYGTSFSKKDKILDRVWVKKDMPKAGSMTDAQRALIAQWIEQGAPEVTAGSASNPVEPAPVPTPSATTPAIEPAPLAEVKAKLRVSCFVCHETNTLPIIPHIFGQNADYLVMELTALRAEVRKDSNAVSFMYGPTKNLDDRMILGMAQYLASLPAKPTQDSLNTKLLARGKEIYQDGILEKGVPACLNCHGANAEGSAPGVGTFPRLAGQNADYIHRQLDAFKSGDRPEAQLMPSLVGGISDDDADAVANYVQSLGESKP